jgi:hypothetical protein
MSKVLIVETPPPGALQVLFHLHDIDSEVASAGDALRLVERGQVGACCRT